MSKPGRRRATLVILAIVALMLVPVPGFATEVSPPEVRSAEMEGLPSLPEGAAEHGALAADPVAPEADADSDAVDADLDTRADGEVDVQVDAPDPEPSDRSERATPVVEAEIPFNLIGFHVPDGVDSVLVRTAGFGSDWSDWIELGVEEPGLDGPDLGSEEAKKARANVTEPAWVGEAERFQVRVPNGDPGQVTAALYDATGLSEPMVKRVLRHVVRQPVAAEAASGPPNIVSRAQWNANESLRKGSPSYSPTIKNAVVHHTTNSNSYSRDQGPALVRSIYAYHTQSNGWNDIGYNLLIDRYGRMYEGRAGGLDRAVTGAHAAGYNTGSFGVAIIGNFDIADVPSAAMSSLSDVIAWKFAIHRVDATPGRTISQGGRTFGVISGHRDVGQTACPGRYLYSRLGSVRNAVAGKVSNYEAGQPVVGDWNGDGRDTPGWFYNGVFYLRNSNSAGAPSTVISFGRTGDKPIVGDWNGDGRTGIGVVRDGTWLLKDRAVSGAADRSFVFGRVLSGDIPIVGDWNGNGKDSVGIVRSGGEWHLRNTTTAGHADLTFVFGRVAGGDTPVVGDWNGDGRTTVGIVRGPEWMLRDSNTAGSANRVIRFGRDGDLPIVGDWHRAGRQSIGVVRHQTWYQHDGISAGHAGTSFVY